MVQKVTRDMVEGDLLSVGDFKTSFQSADHQGWLLLDGRNVNRTTYADLFALIGTTYGVGDGSTTFGLPDLRGKFPLTVSAGHPLADAGGAETVTLSEANLDPHTHTMPTTVVQSGTGVTVVSPGGGGSTDSGSTGSGTAIDKMPPFVALGHMFVYAGA